MEILWVRFVIPTRNKTKSQKNGRISDFLSEKTDFLQSGGRQAGVWLHGWTVSLTVCDPGSLRASV